MKSMTQQDLADHLGLNRNAIAKWETNINWPAKENIEKLAELFDIAPSRLFIDPSDPSLSDTINDDLIRRVANMVIEKQAREKLVKKPRRKR